MSRPVISILVVEDNAADVALLGELLSEISSVEFRIASARSAGEARKKLEVESFDVALLDLNLPDSTDFETLGMVTEHYARLPVIVTTGLDDEDLAVKAVQMGAQDYLVKDRLNADQLSRSIRYAIERARLVSRLEQAAVERVRDAELAGFERFSKEAATTHVTAQLLGVVALRESMGRSFEEFVSSYVSILEKSLDQRIFKVKHHLTEDLRALSARLAFLKAGPKDVVDVHVEALRRLSETANFAKLNAYVEESRMLVLELMGDLASEYRNLSLGFRARAYSQPVEACESDQRASASE
jgi:DNA-binding response OmpR family regulator